MTTTTRSRAPKRKTREALPPSENAKRLYAWLESEWLRLGEAPTPWCRRHGIPDPTVLRWKNGTEPDFRNLMRVANALGRSVLDVLVAGGWITKDEANGHVPQPIVVDARQAIKMDPKVDPILEEALLQMMDSFEDVQDGIVRRVEARTTGGRRPRTNVKKTA